MKEQFRAPQKIWNIEQIEFGVDHAKIKVFLDFTDKNGLPQGFANDEKTSEFKYGLWTTYYKIDPDGVS